MREEFKDKRTPDPSVCIMNCLLGRLPRRRRRVVYECFISFVIQRVFFFLFCGLDPRGQDKGGRRRLALPVKGEENVRARGRERAPRWFATRRASEPPGEFRVKLGGSSGAELPEPDHPESRVVSLVCFCYCFFLLVFLSIFITCRVAAPRREAVATGPRLRDVTTSNAARYP